MMPYTAVPPGVYTPPMRRPGTSNLAGWQPPNGYDQYGNPIPLGAPPGSMSPLSQQQGLPYQQYGPTVYGSKDMPGGTAQQPWYKNPQNLGLLMMGLGSIWNAYSQNKNANKNLNAVNQRQQQLDMVAGGLAWDSQLPNQDVLAGLIAGNQPGMNQLDMAGIFGFNPLANMSQDGIMQMLRGSGPASIAGDMLRTGNPFDTSQMFNALGVVDQRNIGQQVAGLRAGASGLGQRFGGAMMQQESNLRRQMGEDINARNAQVQMQAYEAAQGRRMGSLDQLLRASGMNMDAGRQNQTMQLAAISQMFNQELAQRQYNQGLFSIQAGLPIGQSTAPGYGGAIGDIGQLMALYPLLRQQGNRGTT